MRFGEPHWLWLLALAPLLGLFLAWAQSRRERDLARWCGRPLWGRLVPDVSRAAVAWKGVLLILAVAFLALMAARPQLGSRILTVKRTGVDIVVALDVSESMLAEDLPPNRITRARQGIQTLIDRLRGDRIGLVAFAGEAFVQCPLTLDYAAARMFLRFMDTDLIPVPGTALAEAVRTSIRAFDPRETKYKALVLITDGEDHEGDLMEAAREAREQGVRIFAVGIGTPQGEPIPVRDADGSVKDYKRDSRGEVVMTRLDESSLRKICSETGGRYLEGSAGGLALDRLYGEISGMEEKEMKGALSVQYEDRFGYFAAAALVLLFLEGLIGRRRRVQGRALLILAALLLWPPVLPASFPGSSQAAGADEGRKAFRDGRYVEARDAYEQYAREHPEDPRGSYNLGTALHKTGELQPAETALSQALQSDDPDLRSAAFYNLGNTRARAGDLEGALQAYQLSLREEPSNQDAKYNLELVRRLLQNPPPDSSGSSQNQPGGSQDEQQEQQGGQGQQGDQQNQQDQRNQDESMGGDQNEPAQQDQRRDQEQNQQSGGDEGEQEEQQPQEGGDQEQSPEEQAQNQQPQSGESGQEEQSQGGGEQSRGGDDQQAQSAEAGQEELKIPPEQARQILEGLAQQEMLLQAERLKAKSRKLKVEKDW